ncbi:threonine/serine exporter family protein [Brevibacterium yomogidense]|uniref:threonine/serine ThrE exporter family protein n=1 Tax=Brevibacterium yomogidense TaxID=946573 RepID=UPI002FCCBA44
MTQHDRPRRSARMRPFDPAPVAGSDEATPEASRGSGSEAGTAPTGGQPPPSEVGTPPRSEVGTAPRSEPGTVPTTGRLQSEAGTVPRTGTSGAESRGSRRARVSGLLGRTRPPGSAHAARAAQQIARRAVTKIVEDPAPTTQPIPIVAVLRGTPYSAPVQATAKSEDEARMILDLAVDMGQMMLRAGASSQDVEVSAIATCTACGLSTAEIDLTSNSLTVHYTDPEGRMLTVMRVNREDSVHFAKLSAIHALVTDLVDGRIDYERARERLDAIRKQKRPYPEWLVDIAWGALVAGVVNLVGGSLVSSLLGFLIAIANQRFGAVLGRTGMPGFFITVIQATVITVVGMGAATLELIARPQFLVAAGIILLLPTMALVSSVQDALTEFPLTASGRVITVGLTFAAIVTGIATGIMIGEAAGLRTIEVILPATGTRFLTTLLSMVAALLVAAGGAVGMQAQKRLLVPAAVIGLAGFLIMVACLVAGVNGILTSFLSSTLVGLLARPVAHRFGAPAIALVVPGIYPLLSGLSIFNAAYLIVQPEEAVGLSQGLSSLFTAVTVNAALAVGAVFGTFLATWMPYGQGRRAKAVDTAVDKAETMDSATFERVTPDDGAQR